MESSAVKASSKPSQNPMLNYLVIKQIAKMCDFKVLSSHRQICKEWYNASLISWLETAPRIVLYKTGPPYPPAYDDDDDSTPLKVWNIFAFLNKFHNINRPCSSLAFKGMRRWNRFRLVDRDPSLRRSYLPRFWSKCGEWITDLEVKMVFRNLKTLDDVMFAEFMPKLRKLRAEISFSRGFNFRVVTNQYEDSILPHWNLENLSVYFLTRDDTVAENSSPIRWIRLLQRYPNLKELELCTVSYWGDLRKMISGLRAIRLGNKNHLNLTSLRLLTCSEERREHTREIGKAFSELWRDAAFSLTECMICFPRLSNADPDFLKKVLDFQNTKVRYLSIGTCFRNSNPPPLAESVQKLILLPGDSLNSMRPFESPSFLYSSYPNLTYLKVEEDQLFVVASARGKVHPGLMMQSLSGFHCVESSPRVPFKPAHIQRLRLLMPKVKILKMWLTNETFREVCRQWPRLEHLDVYGDELDDKGITGNQGQRGRHARHNLTHLKNLVTFSMTPDSEDSFGFRFERARQPPSKITGKSVVGGFLKLPNLRVLRLFVTRMDQDLIKAMKEKIPDVYVKVRFQRQ